MANIIKFGTRAEVSLLEESAEESDEISIKDIDICQKSSQKSKNTHKKLKKNKQNIFHKKTKKAYTSLKKVIEFIEKRDEFTIFGEHIASQIRNLNDRRRQCIAQHNINNILFQLSMESYSSQSPDTVTPSSSSSTLLPSQQQFTEHLNYPIAQSSHSTSSS